MKPLDQADIYRRCVIKTNTMLPGCGDFSVSSSLKHSMKNVNITNLICVAMSNFSCIYKISHTCKVLQAGTSCSKFDSLPS